MRLQMTFCAGMFDHMIGKATASKGHLKRWCRAEDCTPTTASQFLHAGARLSRVPVAAWLRSSFEGRRYIMCPSFTSFTFPANLDSIPVLIFHLSHCHFSPFHLPSNANPKTEPLPYLLPWKSEKSTGMGRLPAARLLRPNES